MSEGLGISETNARAATERLVTEGSLRNLGAGRYAVVGQAVGGELRDLK